MMNKAILLVGEPKTIIPEGYFKAKLTVGSFEDSIKSGIGFGDNTDEYWAMGDLTPTNDYTFVGSFSYYFEDITEWVAIGGTINGKWISGALLLNGVTYTDKSDYNVLAKALTPYIGKTITVYLKNLT